MKQSNQRIITGVLFMMATCVVGVAGYLIAGWDLDDAIYMVVITIFGVGYGEVREVQSPQLRYFTIFLIIAGCSALIYILGGIFQFITEGELNRALGRRRMTREIGKLMNHVIICGFGRLGRVLAEEFSQQNVPFVVIDRDSARFHAAIDLDYLAVEGDASDEDILQEAGIDHARALATVLPLDAVNVFITLTARTLNPDLQIVARGEDTATEKKLHMAGATNVVLPAAIGARRVAHMIIRPTLEQMFDDQNLEGLHAELSGIGVQLNEISVEAGSPLEGKTVGQLEGTGDGGFMVLYIRRKDQSSIHNPKRDETLHPGDDILIMGHAGDMPDLAKEYDVDIDEEATSAESRV